MARWIQVLKDGEWAFIRPEAVDGVWMSRGSEKKKYVNFSVGDRVYYLVYPDEVPYHWLQIFQSPTFETVRRWFEADYDGTLTLWHFYLFPEPQTLANFLVVLTLYNEVRLKGIRPFRVDKRVEDVVRSFITSKAGAGGVLGKSVTGVLGPDAPGWWYFRLPEFGNVQTEDGFTVDIKGATYAVAAPKISDEDLEATVYKLSRRVSDFYKLIKFVKAVYPSDTDV